MTPRVEGREAYRVQDSSSQALKNRTFCRREAFASAVAVCSVFAPIGRNKNLGFNLWSWTAPRLASFCLSCIQCCQFGSSSPRFASEAWPHQSRHPVALLDAGLRRAWESRLSQQPHTSLANLPPVVRGTRARSFCSSIFVFHGGWHGNSLLRPPGKAQTAPATHCRASRSTGVERGPAAAAPRALPLPPRPGLGSDA